MTTQESASLVVIAANIGALIWGAAKISSAVKYLSDEVTAIKEEKLPTRMTVIEEWRDGIDRRSGLPDRRHQPNA